MKHNLYLCNHRLKQVKSYKYLGVILNERGTFHEHSSHVITKATHAAYAVGKLINKQLSPSPSIIKLLTNTIIKSVISYGIIFFIPNNKTVNTLNNLLLQPLRYVGLLPRNTHKVSLALEFNVPTFNIIKQIEIFRFFKRILSLPASHPSKILYTNNINNNTTNYIHFKWPSFQELLTTSKTKLTNSRNTLIQQQVISNTQQGIETCSPSTTRLIHHHLLISQCEGDKGKGVKTLAPKIKYYNNIDMPLYLQHDENSICRLRLRLRMNLAKTGRLLHRYDEQVAPSCPLCGYHTDNINHIILYCPSFNNQRQHCFAQIFKLTNASNHQSHLQIILGFVDTFSKESRKTLLDVTAAYLKYIMQQRSI